MIDLYFWTTPNGYKPLIFLEDSGLDYQIKPVNISEGAQFAPDFLKIAPNNRIPAMVDHDPIGGGSSISLFESGAMLEYMAEKSGKFLPSDPKGKWDTLQWLYWQMAGLGPMLGQNHHFNHYAPEQVPYAQKRYVTETGRLYGILNKRLADRPYIAGEYSIADMACWPWIILYEKQGQDMADFPYLKRWHDAIAERPAVKRSYEIGTSINTKPTVSEESRKHLFGAAAE